MRGRARWSDGGEEAGGRAVAVRDLVERRLEVEARAADGADVGDALQQRDAGSEQDAVADEVLGGEVLEAGAVLLEEVEPDGPGLAQREPVGGLGGEEG